jgi:protein-tyrosine-phosphatase
LLIDISPDSKIKIQLLSRYLPGNQQEDEIRDPFGKSAFHYRLAQNQIALAVKALVASL